MQFEIKLDKLPRSEIYQDFSKYVFSEVVKSVERLVLENKEKYDVRESVVKDCPAIQWQLGPPKRMNLSKYVSECLELVKVRGTYVIRVSRSQRIKNSFTEVSSLIRLLEYGSESLPELPLIRRVLNFYRDEYVNMIDEFVEERFSL